MKVITYNVLRSDITEERTLVSRIHSRALALLTAVALVSPTVAHAGPDDGRTVATAAHVDSPKTFWANDTFVLKSEFSGTTTPLDDTVAWVGKGHGSDGRNQYQFTLPENGLFDFLAHQARLTTPHRLLPGDPNSQFGWGLGPTLGFPWKLSAITPPHSTFSQ